MRTFASVGRAALSRVLARLLRDTGGNVALVFGFCVIGLVGGVGIAIDTSVAYNVKSRLSAAVDAAALAGARAFASPTRDADIEKFFEANFPAGYLDSVLEPPGIPSAPPAPPLPGTPN